MVRMLLVVGVTLLLGAATLLLVRLRRRRRTGATIDWTELFRLGPGLSDADRRAKSLSVCLLFATVDDEVFNVDGVVVGGRDDVPRGAPLSLRLRRPGTWWFAECVGELLQGWAEADEVVEVKVAGPTGERRAVVSNGSSSVTLDLDDVKGLPAAA